MSQDFGLYDVDHIYYVSLSRDDGFLYYKIMENNGIYVVKNCSSKEIFKIATECNIKKCDFVKLSDEQLKVLIMNLVSSACEIKDVDDMLMNSRDKNKSRRKNRKK